MYRALGVAAHLAQKYGLVPPDHGGIYGPGETLTYASLRSADAAFARAGIFAQPDLETSSGERSRAVQRRIQTLSGRRFVDWRLTVDGMVERPTSFSVDQLKSYPSQSQITEVVCEEGWSYIAEWNGVPLSHILNFVGAHPQAKYVFYFSIEPDWWESMDMADALHPQTFLTYGMNGTNFPWATAGRFAFGCPVNSVTRA